MEVIPYMYLLLVDWAISGTITNSAFTENVLSI